ADATGWDSLRSDLGILKPDGIPMAASPMMDVLRCFHGYPPASDRAKRLAVILEQCEDLDSACEFDATVAGDSELTGLDDLILEIGGYFNRTDSYALEQAASKISVFPTIAFRAIRLLENAEANLDELESLVAADQALARCVMS